MQTRSRGQKHWSLTDPPLGAWYQIRVSTKLEYPLPMPVHESAVPYIDMKKGKWFVFNQKGFFFIDSIWRWNQRRARKRVAAILRGAFKTTSLMVTANRNVFKHRQSVRSEWRMEFPADALHYKLLRALSYVRPILVAYRTNRNRSHHAVLVQKWGICEI